MQSSSPSNLISSLLQQGIAQHKNGILGQAIALYGKVLLLNPAQADALCLSGIAEFQMGNRDKGLSLAQRAIELNPGFLAGYVEVAKMLQATGKSAEALNIYGQALRLAGLTRSSEPPSTVLAELIEAVSTLKPESWAQGAEHIENFGRLFALASPASLPPESSISIARDHFKPCGQDENASLFKAKALLRLLGFHKTSSPAWTKHVFEQLALPWMSSALACGCHDMALKLETMIYEAYVKQTETEAHFRETITSWLQPMREAGLVAARELPAIATPPSAQGRPTVGFFLHNASMLAHVEVMLSVLENLPAGERRPFQPRVYIFGGSHPVLLERLKQSAIPYTLTGEACPSDDNWWRRLVWLRRRLAEDGVTALVWVSLATMMPFAFAMRMAPVQIWWAMKYHGLELPDIDGYLASQSLAAYKEIDGRLWRTGRLFIKDAYDPALETEATRIRQRYVESSVILGCLGREEKLNSEPFLDSVIAVLNRHPSAAFVWTGRTQLADIQNRFEEAGVARQCHFIGWVDVKLYAQVLDIFLDSFPFPNGFTVMYAMAAGKPVVFFNSREAHETGLTGLVLPVLEGSAGTPEEQAEMRSILQNEESGELFLCANDPAQFQEYACDLIAHRSLREHVGNAMRQIVEKYLSNPEVAAMSHAQHILEIVAEKAKESA